jgi:hypothetical protein
MNWQIIFCLIIFIFTGSCRQNSIQSKTFQQRLSHVSDSIGFSGYVLVGDSNHILFKGTIDKSNPNVIAGLDKPQLFPENILSIFIVASYFWLQQKALVDFNHSLEQIIPDLKLPATITLKHLLSQTSGLPKLEDLPKEVYQQALQSDFRNFKLENLQFQPGEQHQICNTNNLLLITAFESITALKFEDFLHQNIFQTIGMNQSSFFLGSRHDIARLTRDINHSFFFGSHDLKFAGLITTMEDLYRWDRSIFSGLLIEQEFLFLSFLPTILNNDERSRYSLGWYIDPDIENHFFQEGSLGNIHARYDHYQKYGITVMLYGTSKVNNLDFLIDLIFQESKKATGSTKETSNSLTRVWIDW